MGKKKSRNKGSKNKPQPQRKINFVPFIFIGAIVVVLATVYLMTKPQGGSVPTASATGPLIETRPVLSSASFVGKAALAYQYAAEIPKVIDSQFCYCYCKKNHGHKTLLTCFTSRHGSKCDICIDEVIYAYELYHQGKSIDEIVIAVDKKFYRPYQPHRT